MPLNSGIILSSNTSGTTLPYFRQIQNDVKYVFQLSQVPFADGNIQVLDEIHSSQRLENTTEGYWGWTQQLKRRQQRVLKEECEHYLGIDIVHSATGFNELIQNPSVYEHFINNLVEAASLGHFDGIYLDFSYLRIDYLNDALEMINFVPDDIRLAIALDNGIAGSIESVGQRVERNIVCVIAARDPETVANYSEMLPKSTVLLPLVTEPVRLHVPAVYVDLSVFSVSDDDVISVSSGVSSYSAVKGKTPIRATTPDISYAPPDNDELPLVEREPRTVKQKIAPVNKKNTVLNIVKAMSENEINIMFELLTVGLGTVRSQSNKPTVVREEPKIPLYDECYCWIVKKSALQGINLTKEQLALHRKRCTVKKQPAGWKTRVPPN